MKKSYAKPFLIAIFTLFVSISCDQQFDTHNILTADNLLKDKEFLSFMSSVEEARYKIVYRQRDLGTFKQVDGSLERINTWAKNKESVIQNKSLIIKELGFDDLSNYEQIESDIQKKRALVIGKYPELFTLPSEERQDLLLKVVNKWQNMPQIRSNGMELCPHCFFNNCDYCRAGQLKEQVSEDGAQPDCGKQQLCINNARGKRDAAKNQAHALFITELLLCGVDESVHSTVSFKGIS